MTGQCDEGCDAGWTGALCDKGKLCIFFFIRLVKFLVFLLYLNRISKIPNYTIICFILIDICIDIKTVLGCKDGTFGYNCINNCSSHCLTDYSCNKQTGHCDNDNDNDPGYTNNKCNKGKEIKIKFKNLLVFAFAFKF